jgi:hypothetical protein
VRRGIMGGLGADELVRRQPSIFFFYSDFQRIGGRASSPFFSEGHN